MATMHSPPTPAQNLQAPDLNIILMCKDCRSVPPNIDESFASGDLGENPRNFGILRKEGQNEARRSPLSKVRTGLNVAGVFFLVCLFLSFLRFVPLRQSWKSEWLGKREEAPVLLNT